MRRYLSLDTEATGLEEKCVMIQLAVVPVDVTTGQVLTEHGKEWLLACPDFDELKPTLNEWVLKHQEGLIRKAHAEGIAMDKCRDELTAYLKSKPIHDFFNGERPVLLGKSMSALDIPLLTRSFGWDYMQKTFHHHIVDVTCLGKSFEDAGILPPRTANTTRLMQHFKLKEAAEHTALCDAVDMGRIYCKMIDMIRPKPQA
jgi:hypothetical protein